MISSSSVQHSKFSFAWKGKIKVLLLIKINHPLEDMTLSFTFHGNIDICGEVFINKRLNWILCYLVENFFWTFSLHLCFVCSFITVLKLLQKGKDMRLINLLGTITMMSILVEGLILTPAKFVKDFAKTNQLNNVIIHSVQKNPTPFAIEWWVKCFCLNKIFN